MGSTEAEKPLRRIAASFEELAAVAKQQPAGAMDAGAFSGACSNVSVLFGCLGIAFKFAEMDYVAKVNDLLEASKSISTLPSMVELDIQNDTVRKPGSHTRNMLRVKRGIDMVKVLFEQILVTEGNSLRDAASVAYAQVFAPHHGRAIRMAVAAGMYALPSKSQLLKKLNEDEASAKVQMQNFVRSAAPVIHYVEDLFTSKLSFSLGSDYLPRHSYRDHVPTDGYSSKDARQLGVTKDGNTNAYDYSEATGQMHGLEDDRGLTNVTTTGRFSSTIELRIPKSSLESIIGVGGVNLAEIRQISGARLRILETGAGSSETIVEIQGTLDQVKAAQSLLQGFISANTRSTQQPQSSHMPHYPSWG